EKTANFQPLGAAERCLWWCMLHSRAHGQAVMMVSSPLLPRMESVDAACTLSAPSPQVIVSGAGGGSPAGAMLPTSVSLPGPADRALPPLLPPTTLSLPALPL